LRQKTSFQTHATRHKKKSRLTR